MARLQGGEGGRTRHCTPYDAASCAVLVASLSASSWLALGRLPLGLVASIAAMIAATVLVGRVYLRLFGLDRLVERSFVLALLAGTAPLGALTAAATLGTPLSLLGAALVVAGGAAAVYGRNGDAISRWRVGRRTERLDLAAVALASIAGVLWVQHSLPPAHAEGGSIVFSPIRDFFTHANIANALKLDGAGRPGLAGAGLPFYHYAGYVFVAAPSAATGLPTYPLLFGVWTPLAVCLVGLATYVLGRWAFGPTTGLWCLALAVVSPDPSYWTLGLTSPSFSFFSFHRLFQFAPSNAYGLATAGLGLVLVLVGLRERSAGAALAGLGAAAASILFKAQVFVVAAPITAAAAACVLWSATPGRRRWVWIAGGVLAAPAAAAALAMLRPYAPTLALEDSPGESLAAFLYSSTRQDPLLAEWGRRAVEASGIQAVPMRAAFLLGAAFRLLLPLAAAAWVVRRLCGARRCAPLDYVVAASAALYLSYAMFLAPHRVDYAWGTAWNLQHVPFAWVHWLLATWATGTLCRAAGRRRPRLWIAATACLPMLLAFPLVVGQRPLDDDWLRDEHWSDLSQPAGLVDCAEFLRRETSPRERYQDSMDDPYFVVEALAERRPYVGWTLVATYSGADTVHETFESRIEDHRRLREAATAQEAARLAAEMGVRWYLLHPQTPVAWPPELLENPAFESAGHRVYDLSSVE